MGKGMTVKGGKGAIIALYAGAIAIICAGVALGTVSQIYGAQFSVFSSKIPGLCFGAIVAFLGVRYLISVHKLQQQMKDSDGFSWSNFKKNR